MVASAAALPAGGGDSRNSRSIEGERDDFSREEDRARRDDVVVLVEGERMVMVMVIGAPDDHS